MAQSADGAQDTTETVLLLVVSADMPGTAAVFAQCPRTGDAMAAAAGRIVSTLVAPASASETPTTGHPRKYPDLRNAHAGDHAGRR